MNYLFNGNYKIYLNMLSTQNNWTLSRLGEKYLLIPNKNDPLPVLKILTSQAAQETFTIPVLKLIIHTLTHPCHLQLEAKHMTIWIYYENLLFKITTKKWKNKWNQKKINLNIEFNDQIQWSSHSVLEESYKLLH